MGIKSQNTDFMREVNINKLMYYISAGRIDTSKTITIRDMYLAGIFHSAKFGVKILGKGLEKLNIPLHLEVSDASEEVIKKIKELGGSVTCVYRTPLKMREHLFPE